MALWSQWLRQVLWLRLALLRDALGESWVRRIAVGRLHWALVVLRRLIMALWTLRVVAGLGALVVGRWWASIVAIDGLPHGRHALHHIGRLGGHSRSSVGHPHVRLRGHGLRAASHGRTRTEDVRKRGVPRTSTAGLPSPLLVPVVGHERSSVRSVRYVSWYIRTHSSARQGRLFGTGSLADAEMRSNTRCGRMHGELVFADVARYGRWCVQTMLHAARSTGRGAGGEAAGVGGGGCGRIRAVSPARGPREPFSRPWW